MSSEDWLAGDSDSQSLPDAQDPWKFLDSLDDTLLTSNSGETTDNNSSTEDTLSYKSETPNSQLHNSRGLKRRRFEDTPSTLNSGETTDNNSSTENEVESTYYSGYDKTTDDESSSEGESPTIEDSAAKPLTYAGIKNIVEDLEKKKKDKAALAILEHAIEQGLPLYSGKADDIIELNPGDNLTAEERLKKIKLTKKLDTFVSNNANEIAGKKLTYAQIKDLLDKYENTPFALLILRDLLEFHRPIFESENPANDNDNYWISQFDNQKDQEEYNVLYKKMFENDEDTKKNTIPNGQIGMFGSPEDITINNF